MLSFLIYEGKVAVALAVFYMFYRLLLKKETFHLLNRIALVGMVVVSFLLPLCIITIHRPMGMESADRVGEVIPVLETAGASSGPWWPTALVVLIWSGAAFVLARMVISILSVTRIIRGGKCVLDEGAYKVFVTDQEIAPLSWMRYIILSRKDWEGPHAPILAHERAHVAYGHSVELLLVDILAAFQWFNPAIWMLRADLQELHEYEADDAVLRSGVDLKEYQYLLIRKAVGKSGYSVANSFNHSILKNRITMMSKSKSPRRRGLRVLYLLPLVCLGLGLQARTVYVPKGKDSNNQEKNITIQVDADGKIVIENKEYQFNEITSYLQSLKLPGQEIIASMDAVPETPEAVMRELLDQLRQAGVTKVRYRANVVTPLYILHYAPGEEKEITQEELNMIDSEEIQSIDLLQEPEASERYGEKAGNGVVIVTIKGSRAQSASGATNNDRASRGNLKSPVMLAPRFQYGTMRQFDSWVHAHLVYPQSAREAGIEGVVLTSYDVCEDGEVRNVKVLSGVNDQLDAEAVRVISSSPRWEPAIMDNKPVKVSIQLPVKFTLNERGDILSHQDDDTAPYYFKDSRIEDEAIPVVRIKRGNGEPLVVVKRES